mgnify:CR=1 FL=1
MIDFKKGFIVKDCEKIEPLKEIQLCLSELIQKHFEYKNDDPFISLNQVHKLSPSLTEAEINDKRVQLIHDFNNMIECGELIFSAFENTITNFLGPDILVQKNSNVVIQMPDDPNPSELHRDAPSNSPYEIVVWIPMVDCFKTKAMYLLDHQATSALYDKLLNDNNWEAFEKDAVSMSKIIPVKFGQALFFSTTILHGSHINKENETRISLNTRYKNIFSPSGLKNQLQFFKKLKTSDLIEIGSELELKKNELKENG